MVGLNDGLGPFLLLLADGVGYDEQQGQQGEGWDGLHLTIQNGE